MKSPISAPSADHISESVRRLNPQLYANQRICAHTHERICADKHIEPRQEKRLKLNKTEQRMLDLLRARERRGEISDVRIMPMSLKWGLDDKLHYSTYSPDFSYCDADDSIVLIEVKGAHIFDRDLARFRGCRADWWHVFRFEMWQCKRGEWSHIL